MKKTILMFAAAGLMLATPSCKKGENDPFMSFSSRKARVAGDWELSDYTFESMNTESDGDWQSNSTTYANGELTNTYTDYDSGNQTTTTTTTTTTVDQATYTFNKDYTFSAVWNTTSVSSQTSGDFTTTSTTVQTNEMSGNWSFLGKVKGDGEETFKNKERISMSTLTSTGSSQTTDVTVDDTGTFPTVTNTGDLNAWTNNYASGEQEETWAIDQLKGKEMIAVITANQSGTWSNTPSGGSQTTWTNDVYTSTTTVTMAAVK